MTDLRGNFAQGHEGAFKRRLGADDAANPCGSQGGSDDALRKIDRKDGVR